MSQKVTTISPPSSKLNLNFAELWAYRELLITLSLRDIKVRYKQTVLGVAWALIQPLTTMIIFTMLFGRLANIPSDGYPYPVFVFSGLLAWNFFQSGVSSGGMSLLSAGGMISKVYFPRMIIPLASIAVGIIDFVVALAILLCLMLIYSVPFTLSNLLLPFFFTGLVLLVSGLSAWLSAITIAYRDFRFVVPFMLQVWMYLTPIIYPVSFIPEKWRWLIYLNPIFGWVEGIRASILGQSVNWTAVGTSLFLTVVIFLIGLKYFGRAERRFADII